MARKVKGKGEDAAHPQQGAPHPSLNEIKTLQVKVEQRHLKKGQQFDPTSCPIALSLKESLGATYVNVQRGSVHCEQGSKAWKAWYMSERMKKFIQGYDHGRHDPEDFPINFRLTQETHTSKAWGPR